MPSYSFTYAFDNPVLSFARAKLLLVRTKSNLIVYTL